MPLYFFHLRDGVSVTLDPEGVDLLDLAAVRRAALEAAREMLRHDIKKGEIDLRFRIDVEDACGAILHTLRVSV